MPAQVRVQVAGVTFAALWADVLEARNSGDVAALLFGAVRRRTDAVLQDEQDQAEVHEVTTVVLQTAALLADPRALLDATGEVDDAAASRLVNALRPDGEALVGMLVSRRGAPARPSVLDLRTHHGLCAWSRRAGTAADADAAGRFVLGVLDVSHADSWNGTMTYDAAFNMVDGRAGTVQPVELEIVNLGDGLADAYSQFVPVGGHAMPGASALASAMRTHVALVERSVTSLSDELATRSQALHAQVMDNRRLEADVLELERRAAAAAASR